MLPRYSRVERDICLVYVIPLIRDGSISGDGRRQEVNRKTSMPVRFRFSPHKRADVVRGLSPKALSSVVSTLRAPHEEGTLRLCASIAIL